jgi:hypothetical protein
MRFWKLQLALPQPHGSFFLFRFYRFRRIPSGYILVKQLQHFLFFSARISTFWEAKISRVQFYASIEFCYIVRFSTLFRRTI